MTQRRIILAHGLNAHAQKHWFPWLIERQAEAGDEVVIEDLPDAENPVADAWVAKLSEVAGGVDANTILIGHSLGCITVLNYLHTLTEPWTLGGLILISGFDEPLESLPQLDDFVQRDRDLPRIVRNTLRRQVIVSDNDVIVEPEKSMRLAVRLDANVTTVPGAGHFTMGEGHYELPELGAILDEWAREEGRTA